MMRWLLLAFLAVSFGCGGKKKQKRTGDAAPVIVVPTPQFDAGAGGAAADEVEPNDSDDVATAMPLGATMRGKIDPEADADFYRIEVTQAGALTVTTSLVDADLTVDLADSAGTILAKSDRGAARIREGVPNFGVAPGRYTVIVKKKPPAPVKKPKPKKGQPAPAPPPAPPPVSYEITASVAPFAAKAEREPDDDRGTANDLIAGDDVEGFIGWEKDTDVWKLSVEMLSTKNAIDIDVGGIEGIALTVELADGVGAPLLSRKAPKSQPLSIKSVMPVVPSGAPPFHYLTIKGDKSNPETRYTLKVTPTPVEPDQELEPNDTAEKAMVLDLERTKADGTWTAGDTDFFAINADVNPRTFDLTLKSEIELALEMIVDGKVVAKNDPAAKGGTKKLSGAIPANAKAVVRVSAATKDATGSGTYLLEYKEGAAPGP